MKKNKAMWLTVGISVGVVAMSLSIATIKSYNGSIRGEADAYSLTLNSSNGITGSNVNTTQNISTDSGAYLVPFSYNKCSVYNNGHATILAGGSIKNSEHILSIYSLNATYSSNGVLKFRTSYDGTNWGGYSTLNSGVPYSFSSNPYYVEFSTDGANAVNLTSVVFSYTCQVNPDASGLPSEENGFLASDVKKNDYTIKDIYDEDNQLEVLATYTDGSNVALANNQYSYTIANPSGVLINTAAAFASEGEYILTVHYKNYPAQQITLTISPIHVIDITLNTDLIRLRVGETAQLTATVNPIDATNQSINWSSSNSTVLSVSATGLATAKKVGTATITASSVDGNKQAICDFYVKAAPANSTATITPHYTGDTGYSTSYSADSFTTSGITLNGGQFSSVYGMSTTSYLLYAGGGQAYMIMYFDRPYILRGITVNAKYYSRSSTLQYITDTDTTGASVSINKSSNTDFSFSGLTSNTTASNAIAFIVSGNYGVYINKITLTLYDSEARFPTQIYLNNTDCSLGYTKQLEPTFYPEDTDMTAVTWTSSDTSIATVNQRGLVYGNSVGQATITASMVNEYGRTISGSCVVNVRTVSAEGVAIYAATTELAIEQTTQLYPLFTPSETTNQNVSWSSSNSNVATISSSGLVTAVSAGTTVITVTSVDGGFTNTMTITVKNEQLDAYTIMLYLCGSDLESSKATAIGGGYATKDLTEILSVSCPSNVNFVIETGGASAWSSKYGISASKIGRYHVNNKSLVQDASLDQANMGEYETYRDFLEWGMVTYPAKKYGVIMWNHGGAMTGNCFDENYSGDSLLNSEVVNGVYDARLLAGVSEKLEFIAYDVCLAAVQDIAEYNSYNFNYMVASQETESGNGYDYDAWLPTLYNNPTTVNTVTLLTKIADTFITEQGTNSDQTQAVYDLSKMPAYYAAFEALAAKLRTIITNASAWTTFSNLVNQSQKYGQYTDDNGNTVDVYNNGYLYDVFDIDQFITNMQANSSPYKSSCSSELSALRTAFNNLVVYERHGSKTSGGGLNMFCPISGYNEHYYYDEYETNFTNWRILCEDYGLWYD